MFKCLFGHKIICGVCIQCGKTICEIKGHEWIFSRYTNHIKYGDMAMVRTCLKCKQKERLAKLITNNGHIETKIWERIE
jgi:hypothetical protein